MTDSIINYFNADTNYFGKMRCAPESQILNLPLTQSQLKLSKNIKSTVYGIYFVGIKFRDLTVFFYSRIKIL